MNRLQTRKLLYCIAHHGYITMARYKVLCNGWVYLRVYLGNRLLGRYMIDKEGVLR